MLSVVISFYNVKKGFFKITFLKGLKGIKMENVFIISNTINDILVQIFYQYSITCSIFQNSTSKGLQKGKRVK